MQFAEGLIVLVAHSQVERQLGCQLEVVLNEQ